jgi:hypothetical protein
MCEKVAFARRPTIYEFFVNKKLFLDVLFHCPFLQYIVLYIPI